MNSQASDCIVVNSSAIIALAEINLMDVLTILASKIIIPHAVYEEVAVRGRGKPGSGELDELLRNNRARLLHPRDNTLVEALHDPLGLGEAEAIALAVENNCIVVLDDRIARSKAKSMGLIVTGTIGLLRRAYEIGIIDKNKFIQVLRRLRESGFRISENIMRELMKKLE